MLQLVKKFWRKYIAELEQDSSDIVPIIETNFHEKKTMIYVIFLEDSFKSKKIWDYRKSLDITGQISKFHKWGYPVHNDKVTQEENH